MWLTVIRVLFVLVSAVMGAAAGSTFEGTAGRAWGAAIGGCASAVVVGLEVVLTSRQASLIPTLVIGLVLGLLLGPQIAQPLLLIPTLEKTRDVLPPFMTFLAAFLATVVIYRTKDEFKFSIPYVEFRREGRSNRPVILDTSAIIDARIVDVFKARIVDGPIVIPRFVLHELQAIADSSDRLRRNRGRRGLDALQKLRDALAAQVRIDQSQIDNVKEVDGKLVVLAKSLGGRLVTTDLNLSKVAELQGVEVINVNAIAEAMKPAYLPGENLEVKIVKPGESAGQGIGYLDDGTMVVVEGARDQVGKSVALTVTSSLQTHAGKMLFGRV